MLLHWLGHSRFVIHLVISGVQYQVSFFFFDQLDYLFMKYTLNFGHLPGSSDDLKTIFL